MNGTSGSRSRSSTSAIAVAIAIRQRLVKLRRRDLRWNDLSLMGCAETLLGEIDRLSEQPEQRGIRVIELIVLQPTFHAVQAREG